MSLERSVAPKAQRQPCAEQHGQPLTLVIACRCKGCEGELHNHNINASGTLGFLVCTACNCVYAIAVTQKPR
jgi:hypothetical protein